MLNFRKKKKEKRSASKKSIFEVYEPSELERGHFTDFDNEVRNTDIPERMQLRQIPISPTDGGAESRELEEEAEWIYKMLFCVNTISNQVNTGGA